ncbi:MAG: NAD(P)-dependent oxidoreductase, partial [Acidobacteriota bacterium]
MKKRILLLGANGMFGRDAKVHLENCGYIVVPADVPELDITEEKSLMNFFSLHNPDIVINAAAFTDVDGAEKKREEAFKVNSVGARNVASVCQKSGAFLVHISTDYV